MAQKTVKRASKPVAKVFGAPNVSSNNNFNTGKKLRAILVALVICLLGAAALVFSQAATGPQVLSGSAPDGYSLKWSDEFSGSSIDNSKWNVPNTNFGTGNLEDQCFLPENASVANGNAILTAKRVNPTKACGTNPDGNGNYHFTSAMLSTRSESGSPLKYEFKKGYVEANIKMPAGNPFWLGFWLVGGSGAPGWPEYGEMDITELISMRPDITNGTFHYKGTDGTSHLHTSFSNRLNMDLKTTNTCYMCSANFGKYNNNATTTTNGAMQNYHRYGLLWEDNKVTWYLDGYPFRSLASDGTLTEYYGANATPKVVTNSDGSPRKAQAFDAKTFGYNHTILFTNSVGGNFPKSYGYTGGENSDGSYNNGNLNTLLKVNDTASTLIDYVRVYQYTGASTPANTAPTVSLTSPTNGQSFTGAPANVTLSANAADSDGIKTVEFFDGTTSLGSVSAAPYTLNVSAPAGNHSYTAKATDNNSSALSSTSTAVTITVTAVAPTTGTLDIPANIKATPGDGQVTLSWTAVAGADNYTVRWGTGGNYPAENYSNANGRTNPTTNSYVIPALTNGTTYNFSVRAKDSTNKLTQSAYSTASVTAVPLAPSVPLAAAPSNVTFKPYINWGELFSGTACKMTVFWTASPTAGVSYEVVINGRTLSPTTATKVTLNITSGAKYDVSVRAVNSEGKPSVTAATGSKTPTCNLWTGQTN